MKKMILALAMVFTLSSAFANEETVRKEVLNAFKSNYSNASEISWTISDTYYKAAFTLNDQKVFAFYSLEGRFLGLTRYISSLQLPVKLHNSLMKNQKGKWITDLFEVSNDEGTSYYITVEDANTKVVLKSGGGNDWSVFKKSEKV
jgi:hypothetical protein